MFNIGNIYCEKRRVCKKSKLFRKSTFQLFALCHNYSQLKLIILKETMQKIQEFYSRFNPEEIAECQSTIFQNSKYSGRYGLTYCRWRSQNGWVGCELIYHKTEGGYQQIGHREVTMGIEQIDHQFDKSFHCMYLREVDWMRKDGNRLNIKSKDGKKNWSFSFFGGDDKIVYMWLTFLRAKMIELERKENEYLRRKLRKSESRSEKMIMKKNVQGEARYFEDISKRIKRDEKEMILKKLMKLEELIDEFKKLKIAGVYQIGQKLESSLTGNGLYQFLHSELNKKVEERKEQKCAGKGKGSKGKREVELFGQKYEFNEVNSSFDKKIIDSGSTFEEEREDIATNEELTNSLELKLRKRQTL